MRCELLKKDRQPELMTGLSVAAEESMRRNAPGHYLQILDAEKVGRCERRIKERLSNVMWLLFGAGIVVAWLIAVLKIFGGALI